MCFLIFGGSHVKEPGSTEPIVTLIASASNEYAIAIGVPQLVQNVRSATSDSFNVWSADLSAYLKALFGTVVKARNPEPDSCWHARQWHSVISEGGSLDVYCTPPQRHPPLKTTLSSSIAFEKYLNPSAAAASSVEC
jgi:hypothetical protein